MLKWNCFIADSHGRPFGRPAGDGKRVDPQPIPDRRIKLLHERVDLSNKSVLEVGCFEGIHTAGLCQFARDVTAIDVRVENIVKAIVRCGILGVKPTIFKCNLEDDQACALLKPVDVVHHVGVLYHLCDPVKHLRHVAKLTRHSMMIDSHNASQGDPLKTYTSSGRKYRYKEYSEFGYGDVFSGVYDHSKWLLLEDIEAILREEGFGTIEYAEKREERNGQRFLMIAIR